MDSSYKFFLSNGQTNQRAFFMAFFPLEFLRQDENQFIIEVRSNNSSRLSNIFNRVTEPKRNEGRFRKRFIDAFTIDFYKEMIHSCSFLLRNHNKELFNSMIDSILTDDLELSNPDNLYIKNYLTDHMSFAPEKSLAMLILWAFHIDSFDTIIDTIKDYESFDNPIKQDDPDDKKWNQLYEYLKTLNLEPNHIEDYMKIVTTYGINGRIGAIALNTYIETHIDINPLIHCEVANMLYYGNHYAKSDPIKSLNYFMAAANTGYGPALWTMGHMTNHSRRNSNTKNALISKEYYKKAYENGFPLSLNNLGILYHRALVFHLTNISGCKKFVDCFKHDSASGISEIYHSIKDEPFFLELRETFNLDKFNPNPITRNEKLEALRTIEAAENHILHNFFIPAFKIHDYFFAAGSALTIYEHQFKRAEAIYNSFSKDFTMQEEYSRLKQQIISTSEYFSRYYSTESHYTHATIIEQFKPDDFQTAYEHYYIAAFDTPHYAFRMHALIRFIELHYSSKIMHLKIGVNVIPRLLEALTTNMSFYSPDDQLVLRSMNLIHTYLNIDLQAQLNSIELASLKENLIREMNGATHNLDDYELYLENF